MKSIRGAIAVIENNEESIIDASKRLILEIIDKNNLIENDIVSAFGVIGSIWLNEWYNWSLVNPHSVNIIFMVYVANGCCDREINANVSEIWLIVTFNCL